MAELNPDTALRETLAAALGPWSRGSSHARMIADAVAADVESLLAERVAAARAEGARAALADFADDVERRYPNLRARDQFSDWGKGVAWTIDRMRNAVRAASPADR